MGKVTYVFAVSQHTLSEFIFWWTRPLLGPVIPMFRTSGDVYSGFQSQKCFHTSFLFINLTSKPVGFMQSCSIRRPHVHVVRTHTLSAHVVCTCRPHLHIIRTCTCHPHIICSTPHGQHGPKLSFYSDRI